jgi:uncharacterized delta-60 repeat protein
MKTSGTREQGDIDTSFGTHGVFEVGLDGYQSVEPSEPDTARALARVHDGNLMLALGVVTTVSSWQYALARVTPTGAFDTTFGQDAQTGKTGFVIGSLSPDLRMTGAQAWATSDRATILVLRSQYSRSWTLVRHHVDGALDTAFGTFGYVDLDAIRPAGEPFVVKGFVIPGPGTDIFFVGTTKRLVENGDERYVGGIVFRFTVAGRLNPAFAGKGYALVDTPLYLSGRITDAVLQNDGKIVLSTATTGDNGRIVRLLATGEPDPGFGTNGVVEVRGDGGGRHEVEKLAWSEESGLWGAGTIATRDPRVGLLIALDDQGKIPASFNEGKLLEISYGNTGNKDGTAIPVYFQSSADGGVTLIGRPYYDGSLETKKAVVGRHLPSGDLDRSFGDADETGTPKGFYEVDLRREGFNFVFHGVDITESHLTFEIRNGDGAGGSNPDRVTVERFFAA